MNVRELLRALRAGWWVITSSTLLLLAVAAVLSQLTTPTYASTTRLFVSVAGNTDPSSAYQGGLFTSQRVTSYAELLMSEELASAVVADLDLDLSPAAVADAVVARVVPDTVILEVTVTDDSPDQAQQIAASLGEQFARQVTALETPAGDDAPTVTVATVEPARVEPGAVSPDVTRNLALGGVLGLLMGVVLAVVRSRFDSTVKSNDDVQALTGSRAIGTVLEDARLEHDHVLVTPSDHSPTAESIRAIRTNLQFLGVDAPPKVIVVTSPLSAEGKSTLAVNLAAALSQSGSRVLLVEADLRRPRVTRYLGLAGGAGLTSVLAGRAEVREVLQHWGDDRLAVLAAGTLAASPSELLGSVRMRGLIEAWRDEYDVVLLDSPPLLPVTDAAVLSTAADGCLVVAQHGSTRREQLTEALAVLSRIDARLLGVVLTRVPRTSSAAYRQGFDHDDVAETPEPVAKHSSGPRRHGPSHKQSPERTVRAAEAQEIS